MLLVAIVLLITVCQLEQIWMKGALYELDKR